MPASYQSLADRLRLAYRDGVTPPLRDGLEPSDIDGAYAVQSINTAYWVSQGRKIVGRKIGLTSKAVQAQLGVDQPDFGVLFEDMEIKDGGVLPIASVLQPKAEAEIALILGCDLNRDGLVAHDLLRAADCASAAIEIVDSRIADWKITFADTVADNGSSAFFVLGARKLLLQGLDLFTCGMALKVNGEIASVGAGAACLGHPLNAAAWLANTLARRGEPLKIGDVLLTGALGPMVPIRDGDEVSAQIGGLGRVGFSMELARR
ncbi:MAG: fumarylacetoacetate hydrolase family protein [Rhizomicrobium sp.]